MKIALSTDHAGYEQLQQIEEYLGAAGYECHNFGPAVYDADDDYPDYIYPAVQAVARGEYEAGIILGGSGQGEAMVANRMPGVRCTLFYSPALAQGDLDAEGNRSEDPYEILKLSRQHNHANVLSLAGRFLELDTMKQAIDTWLTTPYSSEPRHQRRVDKIDKLGH